jgi:hypothetical protein
MYFTEEIEAGSQNKPIPLYPVSATDRFPDETRKLLTVSLHFNLLVRHFGRPGCRDGA